MDMLNLHGRPELMKMLSWYVGVNRNFSCSVGKCGKYLDKYLTNEEYERLMETYPGAETEEIWRSVRAMCDLFYETARKVGDGLGYPYNREEAHNSRLYLDCTYEMPKGAETFFMVRRMRAEDVDKTAKIWLEGNLSAHSFIPETYWRENYEGVKGQLAQAEVYTYEDDRDFGICRCDGRIYCGDFCKREYALPGYRQGFDGFLQREISETDFTCIL